MEGRTCLIYISQSKTGMSLTSSFLKDENISLADLNDWNKSLRYSLAYAYETSSKEELIIFETTMVVGGGVTKKSVKNFLQVFPYRLALFNEYLINLE